MGGLVLLASIHRSLKRVDREYETNRYEVLGGIRELLRRIYVFSAMKRGPFRWHVSVNIAGAMETI